MENVNIILSTFNGDKYLEAQIDSILKQESIKINLIIRDDGSNDGTVNIIERYVKKYPEIIFFVRGENIGVISSFWNLLDHEKNSGADFIAFCDQDDIWEPTKIISAISTFKTSKDTPTLYYSSKKIADKHLQITGFDKARKLKAFYNILVENYATGCTILINQALRRIAINSEKEQCIMHDWWLLLTAYACGDIIVDESAYILYRQHENNVIGSTNRAEYWLKKIALAKDGQKHRIFEQAKAYKLSFYLKLCAADKLLLDQFINSEKSVFARLRLVFLCRGFKISFHEKIFFSIKYILGISG